MANIEILKDQLTPETYQAVEAELKDKDVKLADLASGSYVSKEKYSALETQLTNTQTLLTNKTAEYDTLLGKAGDNENLKNEIETLKTTNQKQVDDLTAQYESQLTLAAVKAEVLKEEAKDPSDIIPLLDMKLVKRDGDNVSGLKEQLDKIKEKKPYLFNEKQKLGATGLQHGGSDDGSEEALMRKVLGLPPKK